MECGLFEKKKGTQKLNSKPTAPAGAVEQEHITPIKPHLQDQKNVMAASLSIPKAR